MTSPDSKYVPEPDCCPLRKIRAERIHSPLFSFRSPPSVATGARSVMTKQIVQNEVRMQMRIRASVGTSTYDWIMDRRCWLVTRVRACTREPNVYQRRTVNITRHECA